MSKPVAWVPIHPRNGPLWAMATDKPDPERLPNSYPLRPLAFADEAQAAPAPEPSAQAVREPGDPLHDDAYVRGVAVGFAEDDSRRTTLLRIADRMQKLAAAPQPAPSAQAVAHPSHQTVREWMPVSEALRLSDLWTAGDLDNCGQWRAAIKVLADEVRALAASPQPEPSAQGEPVALTEPACHGNGGCCPDDKCEKWKPRASAPSTPPHAVVEAVPLNFDQLQKVMSKHFGGRELTDDEADSAEAFARAIERAHGIAPKAAQEKT